MCTVAIRFTTEGDQSLLPTPSSIPLHFSFYSLCQPEYTRTPTHSINIYNIHIYVYLYTYPHTRVQSKQYLCPYSALPYSIYIPFTVPHTSWWRRITLYTRPIRDLHCPHHHVYTWLDAAERFQETILFEYRFSTKSRTIFQLGRILYSYST